MVLLFAVAAPPSWAWGRTGHRLTALVAEQYLTPEAKAQIAELLHGQSIADVASWADDYRNDHPETAPWHYVDIPKSAASFDRQRDCPPSAQNPTSPWRDCLTDRILYFEGRLGDTTLSAADRAMALKFVVHLIGDIHQPFHALGDDRGGNAVHVTFMGSRQCGTSVCNLHGIWDESILDNEGLNDKKYVAKLLAEIKENNWERLQGGEPTSWANVSHHYAVEAYAPDGAVLTREYATAEEKVVDAELALGGLRLAHVLNRILVAPDAGERTPLPKPQ
jgi:hypothetical protein